MPSIDNINYFMDALTYTFAKPRIAEVASSLVDIEKLRTADAATKLMSLGTLFISGKLDECAQLADKLTFNDIRIADRQLLALTIFIKFHEHGLADISRANTLKHILTAIGPDTLMAANKQSKETRLDRNVIRLDYAHAVNPSVCGTVFFREFVFGPGSRKHEAGCRLQKALSSQGWEVSLLPANDLSNYTSLVRSDFAMIDVFAFSQMPLDEICNTLSYLRRFFRTIIMVDVDGWASTFNDMLLSIADSIDYVWEVTACQSASSGSVFGERGISFPGFGGFDCLNDIRDAAVDWNSCTFSFTGGVLGYNPNRVYWLLESIHRCLPIDINITKPGVDDGLDPMYSQYLYAQKLAATHSAINMTTRSDGSRPFTGRSFEVLSLNRLLVQESCPAFHDYFVEGEHFIEFSDIEELSAIIEFFKAHPKTAQMVCSQGHQFYKDRYSSKKLVEHIQTFL